MEQVSAVAGGTDPNDRSAGMDAARLSRIERPAVPWRRRDCVALGLRSCGAGRPLFGLTPGRRCRRSWAAPAIRRRSSSGTSVCRASRGACLVGAALASAGASYQALFRNPLVSPDILGVSAGAGLGAVAGIFLSLPVALIQLSAFVGGLQRLRWSWPWPRPCAAATGC